MGRHSTISGNTLTGTQIHQGDVINHYQNSSNEGCTCFEYLRLTNPRDDKKRIIETKGGLLRDCCAWILNHHDFMQWRNDPDTCLLWIKGDPGKGKTMLLCSIIDELEHENSVTDFGLAFFFCDAAKESTSATTVLRGLINMLVNQKPSLLAYVQDEYKHAGKRLFEDVNAWVKLSEILTKILQDPAAKEATLIVDALDECSTGQDGLLDFIARSSASGVKWIVSSRNWKRFDVLVVLSCKTTLSLELNETFITASVSRYIEHKVEELSNRKGYDDITKSAVRARLRFNSNNTFLWASFICYELGSSRINGKHDTLALLSGYFPKGLAALYNRMIESIDTLQCPEIRHQILTICMVVYHPITLHELVTLLGPQHGFTIDTKYLQEIIITCGAFLTLREEAVHFIHQSAKEYLFHDNVLRALPSSPPFWHHDIFIMSLEALTRTLRRNVYQIESPGCLIEDVVVPSPNPLAPIQYCCTHWVDHLRACGVGLMFKMKNAHILLRFLKEKLLEWLEALSLMKAIPTAASAIQALNTSFQEHKQASIGHFSEYNHPFGFSIHALIEDVHRFISYHKWSIQNAPLQVYASAIVFSPSSSLVKAHFQKEFLVCEAAKRTIKPDWGYCVRTLEGHAETIDSIVFSNTGNLLASVSQDGVIKIWDDTGTNIQTMNERTEIKPIAVALSPDGSFLASASGSRITLWRIAGGHAFRTINTRKPSVDVLRYIQYSCYILSGSSDGTFNVWDLSDGICVQTCEVDRQGKVAVAASPDGRRFARMYHEIIDVFFFDSSSQFISLASFYSDSHTIIGPPSYLSMNNRRLIYQSRGSGHESIRILDPVSRVHHDLDMNLSPPPHIIVLSENSKRFVASSPLDVLNYGRVGRGHIALQGHDGMITSVAFGRNRNSFVSASSDKTIKVWLFPDDLDIQQQREAPARLLNLFARSHMVSTVSDRQVRVHDVHTGRLIKTYELDDEDRRVLMSRDNQYMVVASLSSGLEIKIVKNGRCILKALTEHRVNPNIHLSDDNRWLASADGTSIKIVDVVSKRFAQNLQSDALGDGVSSMAFSASGNLFATGSTVGVIQIWDFEAGTSPRDLNVKMGRGKTVSSMAFSADAQWIAYALMDCDDQISQINLFNLNTDKFLKVCAVRNPITFVSFSPKPGRLHTNIGTMFIDLSLAENGQAATDLNLGASSAGLQSCHLGYDGYGLSPDGAWIMRGRENWLRIPPDYRSRETAISGPVVTIICFSGEFFIMNLPQLD